MMIANNFLEYIKHAGELVRMECRPGVAFGVPALG